MQASKITKYSTETEENKRKCTDSSEERGLETKRQAVDTSDNMSYMEMSSEDSGMDNKHESFDASPKTSLMEQVSTVGTNNNYDGVSLNCSRIDNREKRCERK